MAPAPTSAYPPPGQAWGNPSWQQHQLWEYPDRIIPYNNEEDWAAKARAWAATDSMPESHHARSQFSQLGRVDEPEYAYRDHFPKVVPPIDNQLPPLAQSNGRTLYDEGETGAREASHLTPTPRNYYPSPSVYEQEVPYTYSSSQDNRDAIDYRERPQERLHSQFRAPVQLSSVEEPHFIPGPSKPSSDISDQPLDFQPKPTFGPDQLKQFSYSHVDRPANDGIMDQNIVTTSVRAWTSTTTPAVTFPPIPLAPSGVQFDPLFASQPSLSVYTSPDFGGISIPNFQAPISSASTPFGLGAGTSLHATNFLGDVSLSLSERPKKAAVPNWLREEIIKKKSAIASTNSLHSGVVETEDADMSRRTDQTDNKSLDSRSIEDEDDDEDEVEAARSAAINQEIKRILTEVLLKVTDELFDEIATKVLDEDEPNAEAVESIILGKPRVSPPPSVPIPKESPKSLLPQRTDSKEIDANEISRPSTASGDLLGLGNYDSDASNSDNDDENGRIPSRKLDSTSHRPETNAMSYEHSLKNMKTAMELPNADSNGDVKKEKNVFFPDSRDRKRDVHVHAKFLGASESSLKTSSINFESAGESRGDDVKGLKSNEAASNERVKRPEIANRDRTITEACGDGEANILSNSDQILERSLNTRVPIKEVAGGSHRSDNESNKHREKQKEKIDKGSRLNERFGDRNVKQGTSDRETHSKSNSRSDIIKDSKKEISKDKAEKQKGYVRRSDRERNQTEDYKRDEKEDRSKIARETFRHKIRSKSPISIGRHVKDNSAGSRASASSEDSFDNPRKRKLQSRGSSLSASPRPTKRYGKFIFMPVVLIINDFLPPLNNFVQLTFLMFLRASYTTFDASNCLFQFILTIVCFFQNISNV
ncbi:hypothetical protein KSP39_PZI005915 [Platanthera zijinensis]|uniref:Uncharacterized protein n=1 Tax=Platanthera zijinensis TaxID=2320716 RepID=A0AAP0BTB0_9ASPA